MNDNEIRSKKDFWFACVDIDVLRDKELSQTAKFVFAVLCTFVNVNNRVCWPSNETLAETSNMSKTSVIRALKELEERGIIQRFTRFEENDKGQTSSYKKIIGYNAECYQEIRGGVAEATPPSGTHATPPIAPVPPKGNNINYIKDTLKRETELPNSSEPEKEEQGTNNEVRAENETGIFSNDQDECPLTEAPEILQPVVCYLFFKTGRNALFKPEIKALNELAEKHTPKRIKHEIDTTIERFLRKNKHPASLRFEYIASALSHQTSLKPKKRADDDAKIKEAAAEFKAAEAEVKPISDEAWEAMQAEMKEWS